MQDAGTGKPYHGGDPKRDREIFPDAAATARSGHPRDDFPDPMPPSIPHLKSISCRISTNSLGVCHQCQGPFERIRLHIILKTQHIAGFRAASLAAVNNLIALIRMCDDADWFHDAAAIICPIPRVNIHMQRRETRRAVIPAGFGRRQNRCTTMNTGKALIDIPELTIHALASAIIARAPAVSIIARRPARKYRPPLRGPAHALCGQPRWRAPTAPRPPRPIPQSWRRVECASLCQTPRTMHSPS